ncbi:23S rRNA (adenine(2030)-N(6))-methyltransferase RlmJ [Blastochloris tepida]|uniref:Ribosomal RNA large subunit methyltransferase J n=1 Tax=Blastochloris tepida TaxID=2233851 RepID=A0A348FWN3_9HYPH|nr:23S rRNA (adenine(2030)-N(6))-methyltransferase RlmJ [Blastochloris tepida]BBF91716.1 ribosomal RNA large subunit methyltransferase J [Blastochloris tepida]
MNYRHAFHAGNFADILKHAVLARVLAHLGRKPAPFCAIDTHAGRGLYDLAASEATRTGEWRGGIGRLRDAPLDAAAEEVLAPFRAALAAVEATHYPGSPSIIAALARPDDRLHFVERHPEDAAALAALFRRDRRVKVTELDGWLALPAFVPPPERRGLVLVDPPFEEPGEFERLRHGLAKAHARWPTGTYLLWYPLKDVAAAEAFGSQLAHAGIPDILRAELRVGPIRADGPLNGCGMVVVNPPWTLEADLKALLPALAERLGQDQLGHGGGRFRLDRLAAEAAAPVRPGKAPARGRK